MVSNPAPRKPGRNRFLRLDPGVEPLTPPTTSSGPPFKIHRQPTPNAYHACPPRLQVQNAENYGRKKSNACGRFPDCLGTSHREERHLAPALFGWSRRSPSSRGPLLLVGKPGAVVCSLHGPRRLVVVRQRQVNNLGRWPLIRRPGSRRCIPGSGTCGRRKVRRGYRGDAGGRCAPDWHRGDLRDDNVVVVDKAGTLVGACLLLCAGNGPLAVWLDGHLLDGVRSLGQNLPRVSMPARLASILEALDPVPGNSLVDGQLVKRRWLVADWAQPLRSLLLQLQVRRRIEALDVVAANAAAWQAEPHVGQRALEAQVLRRGNHIGVARLFRD